MLYKVLRLRDSHAVSGNDDDFFRVVQSCGIVDFRLDNGFFFRLDFLFHFDGFRFRFDFNLFGSGFLSIVVGRRAAEKDCAEFSVHRLTHDLRQEKSRRADDTADRNEQQVVDCKTCDCAGNARKAVKQRNRNGHIRAAYANRENVSEKSRNDEQQCDHNPAKRFQVDTESNFAAARKSRNCRKDNDKRKRQAKAADGHRLMSFVNDGFLRKNLVKFAGCDKAADKGNHTDRKRKSRRRCRERVKARAYAEHRKRADDCRSRAAQTVKKSDHLRHLNHFDFLCKDNTRNRAERKPDIERPYRRNVACAVAVHDNKDNRKEHANRAETIADFTVSDFAHHRDAQKHAKRQYDCHCKVNPIARRRARAFCDDVHATDYRKESCARNCRRRVNHGLPFRLLFRNHAEHTVGNHKATDDVDHCESDCKRTEYRGKHDARRTEFEKRGTCRQRAKHRNARQSVHTRHKRGVQKRRNV